MAETTKQAKVPDVPDDSIDLSAGFVLKKTSAACEPPEELTPDSFMAQHAKSAAAPNAALTFDSFMAQQVPAMIDGCEAGPIEPKNEITWRWASSGDMQALRLHHFKAEVESAQTMYLPDVPSDLRLIATATKDGTNIGGLLSEDSVVLSLVGQDPATIESAREVVIPILVAQARKEGTRFLSLSLPKHLAATLDGILQDLGFRPFDGIEYRLDTGVEADEQPSTRRN